jgi:hypothetical protein
MYGQDWESLVKRHVRPIDKRDVRRFCGCECAVRCQIESS